MDPLRHCLAADANIRGEAISSAFVMSALNYLYTRCQCFTLLPAQTDSNQSCLMPQKDTDQFNINIYNPGRTNGTIYTSSLRVNFHEHDMETLTVTALDAAQWKTPSSFIHRGSTPPGPCEKEYIPLTVDELMRRLSEEAPNLKIVSYPSSGINYVDYTARQLDTFAFRVARQYAITMPPRSSSSQVATVVGLLGPSNFDYLMTILALTKLGHTVLFLSTRISAVAYESLLKKTQAKHLLIDESFRNLAETLSPNLPHLRIAGIAKRAVYEGEGVVRTTEIDTCLTHQLDPQAEKNQLAWIIHSSGSTGLPKPIFQTQRAALGNYRNNLNMKGFVTLPLYHAHGISSLFRSIQSRKSIHLYNASLPLTHDYLLKTLQQNDFEIFYGVPYALKILAESSEGLEALAKMKVVMFGGSACPDALGHRLVDKDVNLVSHYGT
jgi:acyl-CoA synthetase (AMP-forming)/AMP-acid ligase II